MTNATISVYWQQKCNNRHNINEGFKYAESSVTETEIEKISMIVQMCFFKTLKKFKVSIDN